LTLSKESLTKKLITHPRAGFAPLGESFILQSGVVDGKEYTMTEVLLLTHKGCPVCPMAKSFWEQLQQACDFDYKNIEIYSPEGLQYVRQYNIRSVPTTLIDKKVEFVGVPDRDKALAKVNCVNSK
jgi:glutaredoxin